jgi:ribosome-associated protein
MLTLTVIVEKNMEFKLREAEEFITLQSLLKASGLAESGGSAKAAITSGAVTVDGQTENRRGKKIRAGQIVSFAGTEIKVVGQ